MSNPHYDNLGSVAPPRRVRPEPTDEGAGRLLDSVECRECGKMVIVDTFNGCLVAMDADGQEHACSSW